MLTKRPNILLVLTDQQSANMMSCTGNRYVNTPAMDSLAATGARFDRAYCTNPVCLPSRLGLMTGRLAGDFGVRTNQGEATVPQATIDNSLGRLAQRAGYETAYGGKVHLPCNLQPADMGFEVLTQDEREGLAPACADFIRRDHRQPWLLVASFINPHDICYMAISDQPAERHRRVFARRGPAIVALEKALALPPGIDEAEFYANHCPPLPPNFEPPPDEPEAITEACRRAGFREHARRHWPPERWRLHRWAYARLTEMVDRHIGATLEALRQSGQAENTVVIFTSDHGDHDAAHRLEHKSSFYEEAVRVPLIISQPGAAAAGRVDEHLASNGLDVLPTICDYAGIEPPSGLRGTSLRGLAEGADAATWREHLPIECSIGRMIMTPRFKHMLYDSGARREQLVDRDADPGEMRNALDDPDKRDAVGAHRALLETEFPAE